MAKETLKAKGMHCSSCETLIKRTVENIEGVNQVDVDYVSEKVQIDYDPEKTNIGILADAIEAKGYECSLCKEETSSDPSPVPGSLFAKKENRIIGWILGIFGLVVVVYFLSGFIEGIQLPEISQNMGLGLLFTVGLLTGFHCVSMCGGFVVSYTAKDAQEGRKSNKSHLMYGTGKLISYTVIGAVFGLIGSIIAFTPMMRGVAGIIAGLFLLIFGLNMLNVFPWLRHFRLRTPGFISKFVGDTSQKSNSPLIIGLLNGLMIACGPLQAIYIMAAGTGSMIEGAKMLFVFGLGTLPVMLGFGYFASFVSKKATQKILKASGVIVIILGLIMINRGLSLTGTGLDTGSLLASVSASDNQITGNAVVDGYQVIKMDVTRNGWSPNKFVLQRGVPVKWIINGKEITGCNNAIQVPKLGLEFDIKQGEQTIEFTPEEEGVIPFSCWMGMIPGTFIVKEDIDLNDESAVQEQIDAVPQQAAGSCGGSCGSPSCGAATGGGCGCGGAR